MFTFVVPAGNVGFVYTTGDVVLGGSQQHLAVRVVGNVQVVGARVWQGGGCLVHLFSEARQFAFRKFHLLTSLPCTGCNRMVMSDSRWCDRGNMSRMCLTGRDRLLCHFVNARSGFVCVFHRAE